MQRVFIYIGHYCVKGCGHTSKYERALTVKKMFQILNIKEEQEFSVFIKRVSPALSLLLKEFNLWVGCIWH